MTESNAAAGEKAGHCCEPRANALGVHTWEPGAEVWTVTLKADLYVPRLLGHVLCVGKLGFTVTCAQPYLYRTRETRVPFGCPRIWRSRAESEVWCTENPKPTWKR
jgi:hypothetical protein